jgi:hypothetical protein
LDGQARAIVLAMRIVVGVEPVEARDSSEESGDLSAMEGRNARRHHDSTALPGGAQAVVQAPNIVSRLATESASSWLALSIIVGINFWLRGPNAAYRPALFGYRLTGWSGSSARPAPSRPCSRLNFRIR